jgi:hypothetical protein
MVTTPAPPPSSRSTARAFAAEDDRRWAAEIEQRQRRAAARHGGDEADVLVAGAAMTSDSDRARRDRQPERAAHRAAQRLPAERIRRALDGDHARGAERGRGADDRADVARDPGAGEDQHQRMLGDG